MKAIPLPYHCRQNLQVRFPGMNVPANGWIVVPDDGTLPTFPHVYSREEAEKFAASLTEETSWCKHHGGSRYVRKDGALTCGCPAA